MAVRSVYNGALRHVWLLLIPFAAVGWGLCFLMKELEMHDEVDVRFAADLQEDEEQDREKALTVTQQTQDKSYERPNNEDDSIELNSSIKLLPQHTTNHHAQA